MAIDTTSYLGYRQTVNEWCYGMDYSTLIGLQSDIIDGTVNDYDISSFFQSNSDYFVHWRYYPFAINKICDITANVNPTIGKKTFNNYTMCSITNVIAPIKKWFDFTISRSHNNFLDFAPYTKVTLYVPFFGTFDLPLQQCYGKRIYGYITLDVRSGNANLSFYSYTINEGYIFLFERSVKIGIDIAVGKSNAEEIKRNNILQTISFGGSLIGLGVGMYSGNPLITAGSVGMLTKNVTQALSNNVDRLSSYTGSNGTYSSLSCDKTIRLYIETPKDVKSPSLTLKGGVCDKNLNLSTVTGYTEIGEIHFNPMGYDIYDDEIKEIEDLLRGGVHL
mgnify:CR=1 FL=1